MNSQHQPKRQSIMFDVVHSDKHNFVSGISINIYTQYN